MIRHRSGAHGRGSLLQKLETYQMRGLVPLRNTISRGRLMGVVRLWTGLVARCPHHSSIQSTLTCSTDFPEAPFLIDCIPNHCQTRLPFSGK
jgi:hypothetical protein